MENSNIEWTDHTFNGWIGCTKVSPGCANCYAESMMDNRLKKVSWGKGNPRVRTSEANWNRVRAWDKHCELSFQRKKVFCASLSDVFDQEVPEKWRDDLFDLVYKCKNLDWLILTKRPMDAMDYLCGTSGMGMSNLHEGGPWDHVRIGTSAEDQTRWDERVPIVCEFPKNFVSAEPLLGPIHMGYHRPDWLIVGGESGPNSRPMNPEWVRHLKDQCDDRTAFFFKQWGGVNKKENGRTLDGEIYNELPSS